MGYAIAHPDLIATLEKVRLPYNLTSFSQAAAQLVLTHRQLLLATLPALLAERQQLIQAIANCPIFRVWDSSANFVFLRLKSQKLVDVAADVALEQLFQALRSQGTLVRKISDGLRITVGTSDENQRTLARLQAWANSKSTSDLAPF
jgi:histidinol-phosphate aminotransferase